MQQNISTVLVRYRALCAIVLAATLVGIAFTNVQAASGRARHQSLVGTWGIQVTLRDCTTGVPIGPPFNSLVTFHEGGTLSEAAASPGFAVGQRSPGHGGWTRESGHTFGQSMVALILFDTLPNLPGTPGFNPSLPVSPGFFAGWQTVSHTITPVDADHITSSGANSFYKSNGEFYRGGCSTAAGQRID